MGALPWISAWYALASVATFVAFGVDKRSAERGTWRVRERTLHLFELAGGWPGAFAAMGLIRHKNRKGSFLAVTLAIAALHLAAWGWWILRR